MIVMKSEMITIIVVIKKKISRGKKEVEEWSVEAIDLETEEDDCDDCNHDYR